jgi:hypothetical protein
VGTRAVLDAVDCRESNPERPARSPSLYRLKYPRSSEGGAAKIYDILLNSRADQIDHRFGFRRFSNERVTTFLKRRKDLTLPALSQGDALLSHGNGIQNRIVIKLSKTSSTQTKRASLYDRSFAETIATFNEDKQYNERETRN